MPQCGIVKNFIEKLQIPKEAARMRFFDTGEPAAEGGGEELSIVEW
jgi:hypothetical protein